MPNKSAPAVVTSSTLASTPPAFKILSVPQVAELLGVPESSIYEYTRYRGSHQPNPLPCRRVGRYLKFLEPDVLEWFRNLPPVHHDRKRRYRRKVA